jgi:two-component system chemotaxis sensor kinase CheA
LIFAPGFSTAEKVTDVSGRGVGMDVVRTNIAKLGGTVDVESTLGKGTNVIVTLPLTLAIIPSLIIQIGKERFAMPQVNIAELVRVRQTEMETRLGRVKDAEVLRLRGSLLPLVRLHESLGIEPMEGTAPGNATGACNILVVDAGQSCFGLVVDALHDSEEIVVKPLGRHIKAARCLSGATILGDGHVALILDIAGIAADENIRLNEEQKKAIDAHSEGAGNAEKQTVLLFRNHPEEQFAIPMEVVSRIERVRSDQIDSIGGHDLLQYRNSTLPLLHLDKHIKARPYDPVDHIYVVVFETGDRELGLVTPTLEDIRDVPTNVDELTFREPGVIGSVVVEENTVRMIDLFELTQAAKPEWFESHGEIDPDSGHAPYVLLAEDSSFFRSQVQKLFESKGYLVEGCEDGKEAWEKLVSDEYAIDVVVTDIEMPNMNGFELCRRIKESADFKHLPVIALTSLADQADVQHGIDVGIDDYQIKMDKEKLLNSLRNFVDHSKAIKAGSRGRSKKLKPKQMAGSAS